jgi:hypothetical protein
MSGTPGDNRWAVLYAEALDQAIGAELSLSADEVEVVLELARLVAHGTERRNAPLAAFLAGRFVQHQVSAGADPDTALGEAVLIARRLLD